MTHHTLAKVIGVDARQSPHEQWQHVSGSLWEVAATRDEAPRHTDHAAQSGGELVWFGEGLQRRVCSNAGSVGILVKTVKREAQLSTSSCCLLLQHRWDDQLRSHQSQVLQGLGCVQAARLAEHGQQDGLHHALHEHRDVLLGELVAVRHRRLPRGLPVALPVQPPHHAGRKALQQLHELHLGVQAKRETDDAGTSGEVGGAVWTRIVQKGR